MIYIYRDHKLCETDSLLPAAGLAGWKHPVVSAAGAGGKTTLLRHLAREYADRGQGAVVTTTTHILKEDLPWFLTEPSEDGLKERLQQPEEGLEAYRNPFFQKYTVWVCRY